MAKHPGGRPTDYKPELVEKILIEVEQGLSDRQVAKKLKITFSAMSRWKKDYPEFKEQYRLSKGLSAHSDVDRQKDIIEEMKALEASGELTEILRKVYESELTILRWTSARRDSKNYGESRHLDIDTTVTLLSSLTELELIAENDKLTAELDELNAELDEDNQT